MRLVDRQYWASSPLRTWEGWCRRWKKASPKVRSLSGRSRSTGSGKRRGWQRRRSWGPRGIWVMGGGATAVPTHAPLHGIRTRVLGPEGRFPFVLPFVLLLIFPWCASHILGTGLGGGQKWSLRRAATARTAEGKNRQMYAAMI